MTGWPFAGPWLDTKTNELVILGCYLHNWFCYAALFIQKRKCITTVIPKPGKNTLTSLKMSEGVDRGTYDINFSTCPHFTVVFTVVSIPYVTVYWLVFSWCFLSLFLARVNVTFYTGRCNLGYIYRISGRIYIIHNVISNYFKIVYKIYDHCVYIIIVFLFCTEMMTCRLGSRRLGGSRGSLQGGASSAASELDLSSRSRRAHKAR